MIFHVNLRKCFAAVNRLDYNLRDHENAIVSVNENTKNVCKIKNFKPPLFVKEIHRETRAAVYIKGEKFKGILVSQLSTPDVAVVDITGGKLNFVLISAYLPPDQNYDRALAELEHVIRNIESNKKVFICSDTNSRSPLWGDKELNSRGEKFEQFTAANHLMIINSDDDPRTPTTITEYEVSTSINWMANNKAPGIDGFTPDIIKRALHKIITPITKLYNALMGMQYFPDAWKEGFAIFIPKPNSSDRTKTVKDFRPITLLSVLAKVFERLIINRINKFMLANGKLNPRQDGFSKQKSTIHTLHSFRNFIHDNAAKNRSTVAVFLDISGAFDNACWQLIIESLKNKDCPTYLINTVISYFENRKITTNSHNTKLEKIPTQGCPQGSCCGPPLWNTLIDNIFEIKGIKNKLNRDDFFIRAFADDVYLAFAFDNEIKHEINVKRLEREMEDILDEIYDWGKANFLDFNLKKTKAILFKPSPLARNPKVTMKGQNIQLERLVKYLGIWFDQEMTFIDHANDTINKCKKIFNIVRSYCGNLWGLNPELTRLIYKTIIVPVLTYGASIWFPAFHNNKVSSTARTLQYYCNKSIVKSFTTASIISTNLLSYTLPLELEIYMRALIELSRTSGTIHSGLFSNKLINQKTYKPSYTYDELLKTFRKESNLVSIPETSSFQFGSELRIEPNVRWADLPVGTDKIPINVLEDFKLIKSPYDLYAFTDGSSTIDVGTGGSFVIKTINETRTVAVLPLNPFCTVFQSEMLSIFKCLEWLYDNKTQNQRILLCTDSISALFKLKSRDCDSLIPYFITQRANFVFILNPVKSRKCKNLFKTF